jgi:hypothetical protein
MQSIGNEKFLATSMRSGGQHTGFTVSVVAGESQPRALAIAHLRILLTPRVLGSGYRPV